jgi:hypothetical protein
VAYGLRDPEQAGQPQDQPDAHPQDDVAVRVAARLGARDRRERRPQPDRAHDGGREQPEEAEAGGAQAGVRRRVTVQHQPGVEELLDLAVAADGHGDRDDGRGERGEPEDREDRPQHHAGRITLLELLERQHQQRPPDDRHERQQPQQQHPVHPEASRPQLLQGPPPVGQQRRPVRPGPQLPGRRKRQQGRGHRDLSDGDGRRCRWTTTDGARLRSTLPRERGHAISAYPRPAGILRLPYGVLTPPA